MPNTRKRIKLADNVQDKDESLNESEDETLNESVSESITESINESIEAKKSEASQSYEALEAIDRLHDEIDQINEKASKEILKIERDYSLKRNPLYKQRADLIAQVPQFWATTFRKHAVMASVLDSGTLNFFDDYLKALDVQDTTHVEYGYTLTFHFEENPFFANEFLSKTFQIGEDSTLGTTSTSIEWKEGKEMASISALGDDNDPEALSFFSWFDKNGIIDDGSEELGEIIKEDVFPNAHNLYSDRVLILDDELGVKAEGGSDDDMECDEDEMEALEGDEDDEEDEEEEGDEEDEEKEGDEEEDEEKEGEEEEKEGEEEKD